ncbi:MAG: hypothetical protein Kow00124_32290 [Anaerolineae bacterium]
MSQLKLSALAGLIAAAALLVSGLACASVPVEVLGEVEATLVQVATLADEALPTIQAEMTRLAAEFTANAPSYYATLTAVVGTARSVVDDPALQATAAALMTTVAETAQPLLPGANVTRPVPEGELPRYDGGDGLNTVFVSPLRYDIEMASRVESVVDAHNWVFAGIQGSTVTVRVSGGEGANLRARLFGPDGALLASEDDTEGLDPVIRVTLPADGLYTVRVDAWAPGAYTISVR